MAVCPDGHESTATDFCDTCGMRIEGAPSSPASAATGSLSASVAGAGDTAGPTGAQCPQCGTEQSGKFCEVCGYDYATGASAQSPGLASVGPATPGLTGSGPVAAGTAVPAPGTLGPAAADPTQARATPSAPDLLGLGPSGPGSGGVAPPASATFRADPGQAGADPAPAGADPGQAGGTRQGWSVIVTADRAYFDEVISSGSPDASSILFPAYCPERRFQLTGREVRIGRRSASRGLEPEIDLTGPPADPGISHLHAVLIAQADGTWSVLDPGSANGTQVNGIDIVSGVQVPLHDGDHILLGAWTRLTIEAS